MQATYPPGSTFKLVDMAAALASGKFTEDSPVTAAPRITLQGTRTTLENYNGNACGTGTTVSLREALQRSCNTAFADLDAQLGVQAIRAQAERVRDRQADLEIPLAVAPSTIGSIPDVAALAAVGHRAARRRAHPAAERDDRRHDRQRRAGDGAVPGQGDPGPGPAAVSRPPSPTGSAAPSPPTSPSGSTR